MPSLPQEGITRTAIRGPIRGIVFDLDGTLIDSAPDLMITTNKVLDKAGRRAITLEEAQAMIGDGIHKLIERAFAATGGLPEPEALKDHTRQFLGIYTGEDADPSHLYPGALETLKILKDAGYALGLCTNKSIAPTLAILKKLTLNQYFIAISGGDSIDGIRKPDPRHLLAVIEDIGTTPSAAIMIGDKEHDIHCAKDAGVRSILVSYGYAKIPHEEINADVIVDHLSDVPGALSRFTARLS